jgi:7-cyano-7-deazaguanine synthase
LLSGGLDSCVTTAIAQQEQRLALLHLGYGQRTAARELQAFHAIADHYQVSTRLVVSLESLEKIGGSALTDPAISLPDAALDDPGVPVSYVPFRNAHMLSSAVSWAETLGAGKIFIGAVDEDSSGYPDCRQEFFNAFESAINLGTRPETRIQVETPLIAKSKAEIVRMGVEMAAPLELTWSCYQGDERACGRCESCALRLRGFQLAGIDDPIPYALGSR